MNHEEKKLLLSQIQDAVREAPNPADAVQRIASLLGRPSLQDRECQFNIPLPGGYTLKVKLPPDAAEPLK